jgi:hypothetical protein
VLARRTSASTVVPQDEPAERLVARHAGHDQLAAQAPGHVQDARDRLPALHQHLEVEALGAPQIAEHPPPRRLVRIKGPPPGRQLGVGCRLFQDMEHDQPRPPSGGQRRGTIHGPVAPAAQVGGQKERLGRHLPSATAVRRGSADRSRLPQPPPDHGAAPGGGPIATNARAAGRCVAVSEAQSAGQ